MTTLQQVLFKYWLPQVMRFYVASDFHVLSPIKLERCIKPEHHGHLTVKESILVSHKAALALLLWILFIKIEYVHLQREQKGQLQRNNPKYDFQTTL